MKTFVAVLCIFGCSIASAWATPRDMTVDFSWIGSTLCAPRPISPEFRVGDVPAGTHSLRFALIAPTGRELGGSDVVLPANGTVPKGTVQFRPPCVGGMYTWTVDAIDVDGKTLASARLTRPFY
ncbi:hypothetical protein EZH22_24045 [Xanthobacter dioxanivorans]|uniref:Uncharacterized protein n=1 Tax=Xanthobacter dioxanivorans TaxID=2528964 RepID=A0A974PN40_9HYPH|nr:hypothetical protein [Xanthobacter dioxanivorans]QRG06035.1 hypothetical protein EZH22_24045 [Xanthobacter dioxanivorans]